MYHSFYRRVRTCGGRSRPGKYIHLSIFGLSFSSSRQVNLGSIICVNDGYDDESKCVVGVATLLNLAQHAELFRRLFKLLEKDDKWRTAGIMKEQTALLVSERLASSVPDDVVLSALKELKADIEWSLAAEDCEESEKAFYRLRHVLCALPVLIPHGQPLEDSPGDKQVFCTTGQQSPEHSRLLSHAFHPVFVHTERKYHAITLTKCQRIILKPIVEEREVSISSKTPSSTSPPSPLNSSQQNHTEYLLVKEHTADLINTSPFLSQLYFVPFDDFFQQVTSSGRAVHH